MFVGILLRKPGKKEVQAAISGFVIACDAAENQSVRTACWDEELERLMKQYGIAAALEAAASVYDRGPEYAGSCHDLMHKIGLRSYELFARGKDADITEKTAYCSFGFYHGFMEVLVKKSGDPKKAQDFCGFIERKLGDVVPDARYACFHGIGHGWTNVHDSRYWGNEKAAAESSLALCEQVTDPSDPEQIFRCATGVFDSIALAYYNGLGGYVVRSDDPLWLCEEQPEKYKSACYRDMMPAVVWMGEYDLALAARIVDKYAERKYASLAMETVADDMVRFINKKGEQASAYISVCRLQRSDLVAPCIEGLSAGAVQFGEPGKEYEAGFTFCANPGLTDSERGRCYEKIIQFANGRYSKPQVSEICTFIPDEYRTVCTGA